MTVKLKNLCGQNEGNFKYERSLDLIFLPGCYLVEIEHDGSEVGLPANQCADKHYVVGNLVVTESGTTGTRQYNRVVGQLLTYTNRNDCKTVAFTRSYINGKWDGWKELLVSGFIDEIKTSDDLLVLVNKINADITTLKGDTQGSVQDAVDSTLNKNVISYCADARLNAYIKELYISGENAAERGFYVERIIKTNEDTCVLAVYSADKSISLYFESNETVPYGYIKYVSSKGYTLEAVINFEKVTERWGDYVCDAATGKLLESSFNIDLSPTIKAEHLKVGVDMNLVSASHSIVNAPVIPFMTGLYIGFSDGKEIPTASFSGATPYLSTFNIHSIYTTAVISVTGAKIAFYDKDKNYLRDVSISGESAETTYEFSSQLKEIAKYFRVSFYAANINSANERNILKIVWEKDNSSIYGYLNDVKNNVYLNSLNILNEQLNTQGVTFVDNFDLSAGNKAAYNLHNLPIVAGTTVTVKLIKIPYKINVVVKYKEESEVHIVVQQKVTGDVEQFVAEKDIEYFGYYVFQNGDANAEVVVQMMTNSAVELQTIANKRTLNLLIFGDSITQSYADLTYKSVDEPYTTKLGNISGTNWTRQIVESKINNINFNLGEVRNYAKSGASFRDRRLEDRQYLGFQIDEAFADLNAPEDGYYYGKDFNPDVVIVSIGTNDGTPSSADTYESVMSKTVMKTVDDKQVIDVDATLANLDVRNIVGDSVRHSFMRLRERFPDALFIYATPIQRLSYETPPTQLELFTSLAQRYGFIIADCNRESGIVRDFQSWDGSTGDLKDGLHPTAEGSKKIAKCIMNTLIANIAYEV